MSCKNNHDKAAEVQRNEQYSSKQNSIRETHLNKQTLQSL